MYIINGNYDMAIKINCIGYNRRYVNNMFFNKIDEINNDKYRSKGAMAMLIKEVREVLNKYREEDLKQIICELYKSIPKERREKKI